MAEAVPLSLVDVLGGGLSGLLHAEQAPAAVGAFAWPAAAVPPPVVGGAGVVAPAVLPAFARPRPAGSLAAG